MGIYTRYKDVDSYIKKCEWNGTPVSQNYYKERDRLLSEIHSDNSAHIFDRIFSKKTARIARILFAAGFVAWLIQIAVLFNSGEQFTWEKAVWFGNAVFTGAWWTWFIVLIPGCFWYLVIRRIIVFFNPDIEDGAEIWRASHPSLLSRILYHLLYNDTLWCMKNPITRDYAEHMYDQKIYKQYHKTVLELTDEELQHLEETPEEVSLRRRIYGFITDCEAEGIRWDWKSCRLLITNDDDHKAFLSARNEEFYQQRLEKTAAENGWDDWKDDVPDNRPIKEESINERIARLMAEGRL